MLKGLKGYGNKSILKRQKLLLMGGVFLGLGVFYLAFLKEGEQPLRRTAKVPVRRVDLQTGGGRVNPEEVWRFNMEKESKAMKEALHGALKEMKEAFKERESVFIQKNEALEEEIRHLREETQNTPQPEVQEFGFPEEGFKEDPFMEKGISKVQLTLKGRGETIKTVDNTIPAGSFAKAVLLAGVDASTSMMASSDPRPMLLRITDKGNLPRRFKSDLKDCRCTASTYGDISSERVYVRLEKLTCVERETGEVVETEVAGYVAGSDGRAGIRGKVVSKDGQYLGRGLISGVLGGLSSIASPNKKPTLSIGLGETTVKNEDKADLFKSGVAGGASNALDRLSQYYIDRAEQLQPVIQVSAGQFVDIIFTEGVSIGGSTIRREISKVRDAARLKVVQEHVQRERKS